MIVSHTTRPRTQESDGYAAKGEEVGRLVHRSKAVISDWLTKVPDPALELNSMSRCLYLSRIGIFLFQSTYPNSSRVQWETTPETRLRSYARLGLSLFISTSWTRLDSLLPLILRLRPRCRMAETTPRTMFQFQSGQLQSPLIQ